jgi:hypothetical protein
MIYFYKSISPHRIENLHSYLDFFFQRMFAEVHPTYDHAHFITPDFQQIVDEYPVQVDNKLRNIFRAYMGLSAPQKRVVKNAYANNTNISGICAGTTRPFKYTQLATDIRTPLKSFYDELWDSVLGYARVVDKCGQLKSHFDLFREKNEKSVCPFCGIDGLLSEQDRLKNAYDHYIPQKTYPFCSVLFSNLSPICDQCNKAGNKGSKDIPFIPRTTRQRPLYFPYENGGRHRIIVEIDAKSSDLKSVSTWDLNIDCVPAANTRKKDAWLEVFNIESRYKAIIAKNSYKWKDALLKEYNKKKGRAGFDIDEFIQDTLDHYSDIENQKEAIIMKSFHEFFLHGRNFKKNLAGTI